MIGALRDGRKVILAVETGQRESTAAWACVLRDLRERGLLPWKATVADGHLGICGALRHVALGDAEQRCWNHKITNVLDQLPKTAWPEARALLRQLPYAETEAERERLRDQFAVTQELGEQKRWWGVTCPRRASPRSARVRRSRRWASSARSARV
jgi:putative transposase